MTSVCLGDRFEKSTFLFRGNIERVFIVTRDDRDDRPIGQWIALKDDHWW